MKILKKSAYGELEIVDTDKKYLMDCAREHFEKGVTLERVYLNGCEFILVVDENGLMKKLPLNFFIDFSENNRAFSLPVQAIVGDAIFVRNKPCNPWAEEIWDFEVSDVTDTDFKRIQKLLNAETQDKLFQKFRRIYYEK